MSVKYYSGYKRLIILFSTYYIHISMPILSTLIFNLPFTNYLLAFKLFSISIILQFFSLICTVMVLWYLWLYIFIAVHLSMSRGLRLAMKRDFDNNIIVLETRWTIVGIVNFPLMIFSVGIGNDHHYFKTGWLYRGTK